MILTLWLVKWLTNQGYVSLVHPATVDKHSHPTNDQKVQLSLFFTHFLFSLVPHLTSPLPLLRSVSLLSSSLSVSLSSSVCRPFSFTQSCHCFLDLTFTICFEWEHCSLLFKGALKSDILPVSAQAQPYYSVHCCRVGTSPALNYLQNSPHTHTHTHTHLHAYAEVLSNTFRLEASVHTYKHRAHGWGHPGISRRWKCEWFQSLSWEFQL